MQVDYTYVAEHVASRGSAHQGMPDICEQRG
jgi:hypothetical protein